MASIDSANIIRVMQKTVTLNNKTNLYLVIKFPKIIISCLTEWLCIEKTESVGELVWEHQSGQDFGCCSQGFLWWYLLKWTIINVYTMILIDVFHILLSIVLWYSRVTAYDLLIIEQTNMYCKYKKKIGLLEQILVSVIWIRIN